MEVTNIRNQRKTLKRSALPCDQEIPVPGRSKNTAFCFSLFLGSTDHMVPHVSRCTNPKKEKRKKVTRTRTCSYSSKNVTWISTGKIKYNPPELYIFKLQDNVAVLYYGQWPKTGAPGRFWPETGGQKYEGSKHSIGLT